MAKISYKVFVIILGIETATSICSVGVIREGIIIGETSLDVPFRHAEWIIPRIEQLFSDSGIESETLDGVAVSIGPGSFTGLRVGLSAAKGIALGLGCPLAAVPTLNAIARQAPQNTERLWSLIPSIREEVFVCQYTGKRGCLKRTGEEVLIKSDNFISLIEPGDLIIGLIPQGIKTAIMNVFQDSVSIYSSQGITRGTIVALIGSALIQNGETADIESLEPTYLRSFPDLVKR